MTEATLGATLTALRDIGYDGALALEYNPSNPDPSLDVRWGDQTWEEMMFTALNFTPSQPGPPPTADGKSGK